MELIIQRPKTITQQGNSFILNNFSTSQIDFDGTYDIHSTYVLNSVTHTIYKKQNENIYIRKVGAGTNYNPFGASVGTEQLWVGHSGNIT